MVLFAIGALVLVHALETASEEKKMDSHGAFKPVVEIEEDVYTYEPADNGAGPMWCFGSTCLVRIGDDVFASGLETLKDFKPLNNVRWILFRRTANGWELQQADKTGRTREPCPLAGFDDGRLFMSVNPTLATAPDATRGPARPEILQFSAADTKAPYKTILPGWQDKPKFTEHSYRTFAADGVNHELILFQNVGYTHSEWAFRDSEGKWISGKLMWKPREEPPDLAPYNSTRARANYPNVVLKNRAVHFCGASAFNVWARVYRPEDKDKMGRKWGGRWRRLFYTWTPDITKQGFSEWLEIGSTHETGGWLFADDMWVDPDGVVHILWIEQPIHRGLRDKFFPDIMRIWALKYAKVRDGKILSRRALVRTGEGISDEVLGNTGGARFHVTPDNRLFVFYYVGGRDAAGKTVSENRMMELFHDGTSSKPVRVPMKYPMSRFFTATPRAGSPPSKILDLLGNRPDKPHTISYARVRVE